MINDAISQLAAAETRKYVAQHPAHPRRAQAFRDGFMAGFQKALARHPAIRKEAVGQLAKELRQLAADLERGELLR